MGLKYMNCIIRKAHYTDSALKVNFWMLPNDHHQYPQAPNLHHQDL